MTRLDDGPDRLEKEGEWFHPHSRLLILTTLPSSENEGTSTSKSPQSKSQGEVVAYGVFRFDTEENVDDGEDEVIYWYASPLFAILV